MANVHEMKTNVTAIASGAKVKANEALSILRSRLSAVLGLTHQGSRDLYATFGYPRTISTDLLWATYLRGGIANRIVRSFAQATWREQPTIGDGDGDSAETGESYSVFAHECDKLMKKHKVMRYLERADRVSSIGRYGVLVMGFGDGRQMRDELNGQAELLYLSPYSETNVSIAQWEKDTSNPRFGLPLTYNIRGNSFIDGGETRTPVRSFEVHYSRVLHIAEFLEEDDVFGVPRLLPIINYLQDLDKTMGGSAETFWLTANRGIAVWADKEASLTEEQVSDLKNQAESFTHQQQRWLTGQGMTAQVLGSESPDPAPNVEKILDLIAGTIRMPKRIMIGSERGELSSGQDENAWNLVIDERRTNFAGPCILEPFIRRMIETGNLPKPKPKEAPENTKEKPSKPIKLYQPPTPAPMGFLKAEEEIEFDITWPDTATIGPVEESTIMVNKTSALTNYAKSPGVELIMPVPEFRRDVLGLPPESEYELPTLEEELPEGDVDPITGEPVDKPADDSEPKTFGQSSEPRTLYVRRDVLNITMIKAWAKKNSIVGLVDDLHVTVCYSRNKIDWMTVMPEWMMSSDDEENGPRLMIPPGGARVIEVMGRGDDRVIALKFQSNELQWRHKAFREAGASHDWSDYQPHITLAPLKGNESWDEMKAYTGAIALGPEMFEEVKED